MVCGRRTSVAMVILAIFFGAILRHSRKSTCLYEPWHNNEAWKNLFLVYDEITKNSTYGQTNKEWGSCRSDDIATSYGRTHVHVCGGDDLTATKNNTSTVFMFHGAGSNSLIYSSWITPTLLKTMNFRTIAVDFPCDCGRSIPLHGNVSNCPQSEKSLADWAAQVIASISARSTSKRDLEGQDDSTAMASVVNNPVHTIGYSYGCYVSFVLAQYRPELVDRQVFLAPASLYAPISIGYIIRALYYGLTLTDASQNWFFKYMAAKNSNFTSIDDNLDIPGARLVKAIRDVAATVLAVHPIQVDDKILREVTDKHPTLLIIGDEEKVIDPQVAVDRATKAGVQVKLIPNAGHLMLIEQPAHDLIEEKVVKFLNDKSTSAP